MSCNKRYLGKNQETSAERHTSGVFAAYVSRQCLTAVTVGTHRNKAKHTNQNDSGEQINQKMCIGIDGVLFQSDFNQNCNMPKKSY